MAVRKRSAAAGIPSSDLRFAFIRASGPGGQNVNKVATGVQLRFAMGTSRALSDAVRARLRRIAANRITAGGELIIEATRFRTQERNRQDALERLAQLIGRASEAPKARHETRPPAAARQRRLQIKRREAAKKRLRGRPSPEDD
ncbi:MAG: alternative ribosome rescue aminoacyl-tRNA hydrolase ArfB [Armatimonadota bacterium]|nr:alternative ribosome rescue aminoacyl-tRNA hydrolase ArfB [Armatimonadota bacterium]